MDFSEAVLIKDLGEGVLKVSPNTAAENVRHHGVLAQGRLSTAPGNAESFPTQPGADLGAYVDAEADRSRDMFSPSSPGLKQARRKALFLWG